MAPIGDHSGCVAAGSTEVRNSILHMHKKIVEPKCMTKFGQGQM
jgi:hypothetical protein